MGTITADLVNDVESARTSGRTSARSSRVEVLSHPERRRSWTVEQKREIPYPEAVASWYDRVYLPTVQAIRNEDALRDFPHRTEADLYLWITEHHWYMHESGLAKGHGIDGIVKEYVQEHSELPLKRLTRTIRRKARP